MAAQRQPLTRADLNAIKLEKFRALVRHASANAPYYAQLIRDQQLDVATCVPGDFPLLTKSLLMANFDGIVTDRRITKQLVADFLTRSSDPAERLLGDVTVLHTSGTSGEIGYFLSTPADLARADFKALRRRPSGSRALPRRAKRFRRIRIAFYGATGGHFAGVTAVMSLRRGLRRLFLKTAAFEVNEPLPQVIQQLNRFEPDVLVGYTTALKILAAEQQAGRLNIPPIAILATGEVVTSSDLDLLSKSFKGARATSVYACTEHGFLGISNPDGNTMTLMDDNLFFEFHEDHSVITNLFNYTLPMIRYRMSDILRPVSAPDARRIVVESLVGRSERLPTFLNRDGQSDFISPHTINEVFVKGVTRFQMQITGPDSFRFPICIEHAQDPLQRQTAVNAVTFRLRQILEQKGLGNVTFEVPIVTDIPVNPRTRKFQLIVDERTAGSIPAPGQEAPYFTS